MGRYSITMTHLNRQSFIDRFSFSQSRLATYGEIGQHAFGTFGKYLVEFFHNIILIGVTILYFILAAENLQDQYKLGTVLWTFICAAFVAVPFIFTKTLKEVVIIR